MLVEELLTTVKGDRIRLGTCDGSNFIWMGVVDESFPEQMQKVNDTFKAKFENGLAKAKKNLVSEINNQEQYLSQTLSKIKKNVEKDKNITDLPNENALKPFLRAAQNYKRNYEALGYITTNPIPKREIVESYDSVMSDATIYIIKGSETGYAWDESEWEGIR